MIDYERGTGRTTEMLNEAMATFVSGMDVCVTAFRYQYAYDLQKKAMDILTKHGISFVSEKFKITIGDHDAVFVKHFCKSRNPMETSSYLDFNKTYVIFEDHFHKDW